MRGTPKALRECNELAIEVLFASYEKAGDNQGRLTSFSSPTKLNRVDGDYKYYDMEKYTLGPDGKIVKTLEKPMLLMTYRKIDFSDNASDYRMRSKAGNSVTCNVSFDAEGDAASNMYTISRDSDSIYWRETW